MSINQRTVRGRPGLSPRSVINMVRRFTRRYGVPISWIAPVMEENSRGHLVTTDGEITKLATVLILKEKINPLNPQVNVAGLGQDYARYIMTLPDVDIQKDLVITDNHNMHWKIGIVDWFDVGGVCVAKQAKLIEVA